MRDKIIIDRIFTDLTKDTEFNRKFNIEPIGSNANFNQVRNYIDFSKNPNELGSNFETHELFKNTKEHREYYHNLKDGALGSHYADLYYSVANAEMKRVQEAELGKAHAVMDYRATTTNEKESNAAHGYENLVEKVELKHKLEKDIFNFHDKVVRNEAPNKQDYKNLENSYIAYNSFDNPNFINELNAEEARLTNNQKIGKETYSEQLEKNSYQWKIEAEEVNVLNQFKNDLSDAYPSAKPAIQNKINKFQNDSSYRERIMEPYLDKIEDEEFQAQRAQIKGLNETPIPEVKVEKDLTETNGVNISKELYDEAMQGSDEIRNIFNSMNSDQPAQEVEPLEEVKPDYNPFDQENIDEWKKQNNFDAYYDEAKNSPEVKEFIAKINTISMPEYQPTQFGPSESERMQTGDNPHVISNWDSQSNAVKTELFNQEQRLKERGVNFNSVIPEENNTVMTNEYYTKHPEKKVIAEQAQLAKQEQSIKPIENVEQQEEKYTIQNTMKNVQRMRMTYS